MEITDSPLSMASFKANSIASKICGGILNVLRFWLFEKLEVTDARLKKHCSFYNLKAGKIPNTYLIDPKCYLGFNFLISLFSLPTLSVA